jgi:tetratricopeptide (TPR) repeat protein
MYSESTADPFHVCLFFVERGMHAARSANSPIAEKAFSSAQQAAQQASPDHAEKLSALLKCCECYLKERTGKIPEAKALREKALPLVDAIEPESSPVEFNLLMLDVLHGLEEHWRAIRFCEEAILQYYETEGPTGIVELLSMAGYSYMRSGLKEEATVPLRAALKILRDRPGDPRLSSVLIELANALHKSSPKEAEELYKEAAGIFEGKAQLESATTPWVNLGILCSEQGRYAESLDYYERALHIRECIPSTPPAKIGVLLNNIANCYRRMGRFDEALQSADHAIAILEAESGPSLASAYGTRGQILHYAGRHEEAVEWLERSYAERQKSPNPDLDALTENLDLEISSLRSMGDEQAAAQAEERLAAAKKTKENAPHIKLDLGPDADKAEGAVLIEFALGRSIPNRHMARDARNVADQITTILETRNLGFFGGRVVIPESTTLMFHGGDAEEMYRAMELLLKDHAIFAGAAVTIRQGSNLRVVMIPQTVN